MAPVPGSRSSMWLARSNVAIGGWITLSRTVLDVPLTVASSFELAGVAIAAAAGYNAWLAREGLRTSRWAAGANLALGAAVIWVGLLSGVGTAALASAILAGSLAAAWGGVNLSHVPRARQPASAGQG